MENEKTLGGMISSLRRERGMTQNDLAEKMGVTDKAVSKWERDLSCPDIYSLPRLAEIFDISVDELLQAKDPPKTKSGKNKADVIIDGALRGIALAQGVFVVVGSALRDLGLGEFSIDTAVICLGIGLFCMGLYLLRKEK